MMDDDHGIDYDHYDHHCESAYNMNTGLWKRMMRHITVLLVAILQCLASLRSEQVAGEQFDEAKGGGFSGWGRPSMYMVVCTEYTICFVSFPVWANMMRHYSYDQNKPFASGLVYPYPSRSLLRANYELTTCGLSSTRKLMSLSNDQCMFGIIGFLVIYIYYIWYAQVHECTTFPYIYQDCLHPQNTPDVMRYFLSVKLPQQ